MEKLLQALKSFSGKKVMVVGDLGIDEYVHGVVKRISPEAPVPVLEVSGENHCLGLSGNVAQNIRSLGAEPHLLSVVGDDKAGEDLKELLQKERVTSSGLVVDPSRPTTRKLRVMTGPHHIVRVDYEKKRFLSPAVESRLLQQAAETLPQMDAVILQDYAKGVVSESLSQKLMALAKAKQVPVFVDPHRMAPLKIYRGATVFKPNFDEAVVLSGLPAESLHQSGDFISQLGGKLLAEVEAEYVVLTRGKDGMSIFPKSGQASHVPTVAKQVYDVTGAGDTVIATLAVAFSAGLSLVEACRVANFAAGVVVGEIGCVPCRLDQLETVIRQSLKV